MDTFQTPIQHVQEVGIRVHHIQNLHSSFGIFAIIQKRPAKRIHLCSVREYSVQRNHRHIPSALISFILCSARANSTIEAKKLSGLDLFRCTVGGGKNIRCNPALLEPLPVLFALSTEFIAGEQVRDLIVLTIVQQNTKGIAQRIIVCVDKRATTL